MAKWGVHTMHAFFGFVFLFLFGSAEFDESSLGLVDKVAEVLMRRTDIELLGIEGHTDERGSDEYNEELAMRRAEAVRDELIRQGIAPERLQVIAYGARDPKLDDAGDESAHLRNRRVAFRVLRWASDEEGDDTGADGVDVDDVPAEGDAPPATPEDGAPPAVPEDGAPPAEATEDEGMAPASEGEPPPAP